MQDEEGAPPEESTAASLQLEEMKSVEEVIDENIAPNEGRRYEKILQSELKTSGGRELFDLNVVRKEFELIHRRAPSLATQGIKEREAVTKQGNKEVGIRRIKERVAG